MIIDACQHSFSTLSTRVLPKHMADLEAALGTALPASEFIRPGMGIKRIAGSLGRAADFRGCYVFVDGTRPFYVGISKKVIERVRQHLRGRTHFEATLAYRMAERGTAKRTRAVNMSDPAFSERFERQKKSLARSQVAFVEVSNPLELYLFEVYAAMALGTGRWNSFETH